MYQRSNLAKRKKKKKELLHGGDPRTLHRRVVVVLRGGVRTGWEGRGKRGEEEKQVPQSYRAGASKDSEGGKEGWREGRRGRKTLVKLSTDA